MRVRPYVLVAEDDQLVQEILEVGLGAAGYRVECVGDGAVALERARARRPELLILDLLVPGLDGFEVLRRLRTDAALQDLPVVVVSALRGADHVAAMRKLGALAHVVKPFSPSELARQLRALGFNGQPS